MIQLELNPETEDTLDEMDNKEYDELMKALEENTMEFTTLKLIEELAELQEKLIKFHLKNVTHKPKLEEILDEIGDVNIRTALFLDRHETEEFDTFEYVDERVEKKLKKLNKYRKEGKYKGGL
jgi:L-rhamnose mutarotase